MNNTRKTFAILMLAAALFACGRPEKPVARVAGKWVSSFQWNAFVKTHSLSEEKDAERLKKGLDQLVRREVAAERARRKGLLAGIEWERQNERIERSVLAKNYMIERYLQGKTEPGREEIETVLREEKSLRHIMGVGVRELADARAVAEQLRKGGDIKAIFEKHRGELKDGPSTFDLGAAAFKQVPPEIQPHFFTAAPGTVLEPIKYGNEGYIVPVLQELKSPDPAAKTDPSILKRAETIRYQKAVIKATEELKAKYPESFDAALVSSLISKDKPSEEDLGKTAGTVGKEKIAYSQLLETFHNELQRSGGQLQRSVDVFQGIFRMLASERRVASAARDEGYLKKEEVNAQLWDFSRDAAAMIFMQDFIQNYEVADKDLRAFFEGHQDLFRPPASLHLRYLISADKKALENAMAVVKNGAPWESALKAPGILPETGSGDLGWKTFSDLSGVFSPGLMSNISKVQKGNWIADQIAPGKFAAFQVLDRESGAPADFEKSREEVRRRYLMDKGPSIIDEYLDNEGRKGIKVKTFPQNLT